MSERYFVIVDMNQPGRRVFVPLMDRNDRGMAEFTSLDEIEARRAWHPLRVFDWIVINIDGPRGLAINRTKSVLNLLKKLVRAWNVLSTNMRDSQDDIDAFGNPRRDFERVNRIMEKLEEAIS